MIKEFKCYTLLCDNCGVDLNKDSEVSGWGAIDNNYDLAMGSGWVEDRIDKKWYCCDCATVNDADEIMLDLKRKDKYR